MSKYIGAYGKQAFVVNSTPVKPYKKPKSALHTFALLKMGC